MSHAVSRLLFALEDVRGHFPSAASPIDAIHKLDNP
jgi:hypothetical protein